MVSTERVMRYTKIEPEAALETDTHHQPPQDWPSSGQLTFDHVSFSYRNNGVKVLKDVSFTIADGEKVTHFIAWKLKHQNSSNEYQVTLFC